MDFEVARFSFDGAITNGPHARRTASETPFLGFARGVAETWVVGNPTHAVCAVGIQKLAKNSKHMDLKSLYFENDPKLFNILTTETPKAQNKSAQINTPLDKSFVNCEGYLWCITQSEFSWPFDIVLAICI